MTLGCLELVSDIH